MKTTTNMLVFNFKILLRKAKDEVMSNPAKNLLMLTPLFFWLFLFQFAVPLVPTTIRPTINTTILPTLEGLIFQKQLLYEVFPTNDFLVILAAIPYLAHFSLPFLFVPYLIWKDGKPFLFLFYFGIINAMGVMTHITFPTTPPWYNEVFGNAAPDYTMHGDCGRLKIADGMLGFPLFEGIYGNSPVVFGSFPSLHAVWPLLISIYTSLLRIPFPMIKWVYVSWIWWAAVYTMHHFFLDVLGGALYTVIALFVCIKVFGIGADAIYRPNVLPVRIDKI